MQGGCDLCAMLAPVAPAPPAPSGHRSPAYPTQMIAHLSTTVRGWAVRAVAAAPVSASTRRICRGACGGLSAACGGVGGGGATFGEEQE